jgi:hypothetical protein
LTSAIVLALTLSVGTAGAQSRDAAKADALFREGRALLTKGEYATACPKLEESYRLDPAPGTGINLGDCFEKVGKVASALLAYQAAFGLLRASDPRVAPVKQEIAALEKRTPYLTIQLAGDAPRETHLLRDGRKAKVGARSPVNPGRHAIVVSSPGRRTSRLTITLAEAEARTVTVNVGEPVDVETSATGTPTTSVPRGTEHKEVRKEPPSDGSTQRTLGYVLGGVGVISLTVGGIFFGLAKSVSKDCASTPDCKQLTDDEQSKLDKATGAGIVGAVALAGGVALVLLAPEGSAGTGRLHAGATASGNVLRLNVGGSF